MKKRIDLHIHTNKSDGALTPKEVIDEAVRNGVDTIAIADHDTVEAYDDSLFEYAKANGYDAVTTTLLYSIYQNHDFIKEYMEKLSEEFGIEFLYRDFRVGFREGQAEARELGLYMQKYCGCVFSEEDRYSKQIKRDKE